MFRLGGGFMRMPPIYPIRPVRFDIAEPYCAHHRKQAGTLAVVPFRGLDICSKLDQPGADRKAQLGKESGRIYNGEFYRGWGLAYPARHW